MDESRKDFEQWFDEHMYIGSKCIADPATKRRMFCAWIAAWQASREAIEIELPDAEDYWNGTEGKEVMNHRQLIADSADAIRAAGIKVKE